MLSDAGSQVSTSRLSLNLWPSNLYFFGITTINLDLSYEIVLLLLLLLLLFTAIELSLGGSSPYTSPDKTITINIHK
jgi:polyferredoxin